MKKEQRQRYEKIMSDFANGKLFTKKGIRVSDPLTAETLAIKACGEPTEHDVVVMYGLASEEENAD